jgi:hypothetical protein
VSRPLAGADGGHGAADGRLDGLVVLSGSDAPALAASEEQLAVGLDLALVGPTTRRRRPVVPGHSGFVAVGRSRHEGGAGVTEVGCEVRSGADALVRRHEGPVARVELEDGLQALDQEGPQRHEVEAR